MNLTEILKIRGFDSCSTTKLLRHKDNKTHDLKMLYESGMIQTYQSVQSKDIFRDCDYVMSFLGTEASKAKFIGLYRITGITKVANFQVPRDFPYPDFFKPEDFYYEMEELDNLDDLKDRMIIDWGNSAIQWQQWLKSNDKEVVEILPKGYFEKFPGFLDFTLSFNELKKVIDNPDANREWHRMLGSVAGVYLILDTEEGLQYIGSASGERGILGRWEQYAKSQHGHNKLLVDLLAEHPERHKSFKFTILQTLPRTLTKKEVIAHEVKYKNKLGTRAFGLNGN
ncbi:MAG: GIY-YIG nuclease family protein [Dethiobacter sp.]|jgi:hypothetical protein|nr:GIY-YIG nuclease family protein [Dethiobacter sp.]